MASVGSATKVDGIDLQVVVNAVPAFTRPQTSAAAHTDADADTRISASGKLRSATSAVLDAAHRLTQAQTWSATKATSQDSSVVEAVSDQADVGDHSVSVDMLAAAQATSSATFSSLSTVIGIGTLNIEIGNWNTSQTAFATNPNWPKANVVLGPKDRSLERIKDKINAAGVGVIATVVSDATGSRLVLRSTSTGSDNGFKITTEPADKTDANAAQTLAALGFDPSSVNDSGKLIQRAQDAKLRVDGREISSPQNLIEDDASGLSLRLQRASKEDVGIRVDADTHGMAQQVQAFAHAYNDMAAQLSQGEASQLDSSAQAAQGVRQRVEAVLRPTSGPSSISNALKAVGVKMNRDGRIEVDSDKLGSALKQAPERVQALFSSDQGPGLATRLQDLSADGPTTPSSTSTNASNGDATTGGSTLTAAGARYRQRLLEQYAAPVLSSQDDDEGSDARANHDEERAMAANAV